MPETNANVRAAYSLAAEAYAEKFLQELDFKPRDVELLEQLAGLVGKQQYILDLGCGPGHTTAKLAELGLNPTGVDLSPGMIAKAKSLFPTLNFVEGDLFQLADRENSVCGILAFYCIVHLQRNQLESVFSEMYRVLKPGGVLLVSFHIGTDRVVAENFLDTKATLEFSPFLVGDVQTAMNSAGLKVLEVIERPPYEAEYPTDRCYVFARKEYNRPEKTRHTNRVRAGHILSSNYIDAPE